MEYPFTGAHAFTVSPGGIVSPQGIIYTMNLHHLRIRQGLRIILEANKHNVILMGYIVI